MIIHPTAIVDHAAQLGQGVRVGPHAVIEAGAVIGDDCEIMAGAIVHGGVTMGRGNVLHPHCVIGGEPQVIGFDRATATSTILGDGNVLREHFTIHRAMKPGASTRIGNNCYLMASSHVAHDCQVGNNVTMVNYAALAGHCLVEDRAFISGHVGVHQFTRIGSLAMLGGQAGVGQDVPPFMTVRGGELFYAGLNVVGMRRAGIPADTRLALRHCYKELFHSGRMLKNTIEALRAEFGASAPPEVAHLLDFCSAPTKRGILMNTLPGRAARGRDLPVDTEE